MTAPGSELGWVVHFAPVVRFIPLSPKRFISISILYVAAYAVVR